jgi:hypothetical protein
MKDDFTQLAKDINMLSNLKWISIDKDNMEFRITATCFAKEAFDRVLEAARQYNDLATS